MLQAESHCSLILISTVSHESKPLKRQMQSFERPERATKSLCVIGVPRPWRASKRHKRGLIRSCHVFFVAFKIYRDRFTAMFLRSKKKLKRLCQFLRAGYVAMRHGVKPNKILIQSLFARFSTKPGSVWSHRIRTCLRCPIYSRSKKTCGDGSDSLGCLCWVPIKAGNPNASCWARENNLDLGWTL